MVKEDSEGSETSENNNKAGNTRVEEKEDEQMQYFTHILG